MHFLLIVICFLVNFWVETMDTSNYLRNRLFTKCSKYTVIPKEIWIRNRQNIQYLWIFDCRASIFIPSEKRTKSDIHKTWKGIFISYTDINKYVKVWVPWIYQVFIASKPILNKKQCEAHFLIEHSILPPEKLLKILPKEPRPCGQP